MRQKRISCQSVRIRPKSGINVPSRSRTSEEKLGQIGDPNCVSTFPGHSRRSTQILRHSHGRTCLSRQFILEKRNWIRPDNFLVSSDAFDFLWQSSKPANLQLESYDFLSHLSLTFACPCASSVFMPHLLPLSNSALRGAFAAVCQKVSFAWVTQSRPIILFSLNP